MSNERVRIEDANWSQVKGGVFASDDPGSPAILAPISENYDYEWTPSVNIGRNLQAGFEYSEASDGRSIALNALEQTFYLMSRKKELSEDIIADNNKLKTELKKQKLFEERNSRQNLAENYDQYGNQYEFTPGSAFITTGQERVPFKSEPNFDAQLKEAIANNQALQKTINGFYNNTAVNKLEIQRLKQSNASLKMEIKKTKHAKRVYLALQEQIDQQSNKSQSLIDDWHKKFRGNFEKDKKNWNNGLRNKLESRLTTLFFGILPPLIVFLVAALIVFSIQKATADCDTLYVKPGIGFKLDGERYGNTYRDDPYFVRLEAGIECDNLVFGVSHGRQIYSNKRYFETKEDHYKSAVFIDYKFGWKI